MVSDIFTKQATLYPLIVSLLIAILGHSSNAESPKNHNNQTVTNNSENLIELSKPTTVKDFQTTSLIDEKIAFNLVWKLRIVQRKAREIEKLSKGSIKVGAVLDSCPTADQSYYTIRVVENHVKHVDTIYWFRVLTPSGNIEVLDLVENEYIPLDNWKPN